MTSYCSNKIGFPRNSRNTSLSLKVELNKKIQQKYNKIEAEMKQHKAFLFQNEKSSKTDYC